jgi:DNA-binding MarR family transcriptional regulator
VSLESLRQELALDVVDALHRANQELTAHTAAACADLGVSGGEVASLKLLLAFPDGLSQSDWSRLQKSSRQYVHTLTRELGKRGLLEVGREGKHTCVRVTPAGRSLITEAERRINDAVVRLLATIEVSELQQLLRLMSRLVEAAR